MTLTYSPDGETKLHTKSLDKEFGRPLYGR
jgi:hypothetical protein